MDFIFSLSKLLLTTLSKTVENHKIPAFLRFDSLSSQCYNIGKSSSNPTSWLAGKVICEKCGHGMTIIKGKPDKNGVFRRYFNCTGKSHKKICTGPKTSIYAEDLENMVYDCITEKLTDLTSSKRTAKLEDTAEINDLKLKIKAIE